MTHEPANETTLRATMVTIGQQMYARNLVAGADGNLSVRLDATRILTTPAGRPKGLLTPDELVIVDLDGAPIGPGTPSTELKIHLAAYHARPDVRAAVHAHPPLAVACTLAGISIDSALLPELLLSLGDVPLAPYARTGTQALADSIAPFLPEHDAIMLDHHGALTLGDSLMQAFLRMEQLEHAAQIILAAYQAGGAHPLPREHTDALRELRAHQRQQRSSHAN